MSCSASLIGPSSLVTGKAFDVSEARAYDSQCVKIITVVAVTSGLAKEFAAVEFQGCCAIVKLGRQGSLPRRARGTRWTGHMRTD